MSELLQLEGIIPDEYAGLRLDQALAQVFPDYSRGQITKWIKAGHVLIDQQSLRPRDSVSGGEHIIISAQIEIVDDTWTAEAIQLDIIHEDDDLLIINKPAGMVVHPGAGNQQGTLVNALLHHAPQLETIPRAGIVHRIDKGTTGLLMIAKTLQAHNSLVSQLQARTVQREYQAIAMGVMTAGGTVDEPVGRHPVDRKRMAVTGAGKPAITHYRVEHRYRAHTHIRCKLETGRTHQIRVHMAHIRYPLLGDPVYGGRLRLPKGASESCLEALQNFRRQALHAGLLGFIHPRSEQEVSWQVDMPEDMLHILAVLAEDQKLHG
ncbi:MAG: 23S rRNA pseudouridine(1911/1915/1917) synthase RluD [Gammaproteobacteria bacterium]|nr:23S rRNA pseudouridine(1911/1915/1917) synthase RluD [Gammaproteobacteria bacterium]MDH5592667.1 23S rRNA pseudouridine(1911/1915/1917) synthase RluD [Gammaproteobacteria bacterium]